MQITGGSALGKDDINRMVQEAEAHAEEDRKRREAVELRNEADNLVFRTEKLISENADKIDDDVKTPVEEALAEVKTALEGEDNDAVKAAVEKLNTTSAALGQAMYAAAQAAQQAPSRRRRAEPRARANASARLRRRRGRRRDRRRRQQRRDDQVSRGWTRADDADRAEPDRPSGTVAGSTRRPTRCGSRSPRLPRPRRPTRRAPGRPRHPVKGIRVSELETALAERTADLQRLQAEYVNYKRRVDRDRDVSRKSAIESVLKDLLPVLDDIRSAREHGELTGAFKAVGDEVAGESRPSTAWSRSARRVTPSTRTSTRPCCTRTPDVTETHLRGDPAARLPGRRAGPPAGPGRRRRARPGRPRGAGGGAEHVGRGPMSRDAGSGLSRRRPTARSQRGGARSEHQGLDREGLLQGPRRREGRQARGDQEGVPQAGPGQPPGPEPGQPGAEQRFKEISEANDVLSSTEKRKEYDEARRLFGGGGFRFPGAGGSRSSGGPRWRTCSGPAAATPTAVWATSSAGCSERGRARRPDPALLHQPRTPSGQRRRGRGDRRLHRGHRRGSRSACRWSPTRRATPATARAPRSGTVPRVCPTCEGSGMQTSTSGGVFAVTEPCRDCRGRGMVVDDPCPVCHGSGRAKSTRTMQVRIPAGVTDGQRIRLKGKGGAGENGGGRGRPLRRRARPAAPGLRPQGRQPDPDRPGHLQRGRAGRRDRGADPGRSAGEAAGARRHAQRPRRSGCAARVWPSGTAATATCWSASR